VCTKLLIDAGSDVNLAMHLNAADGEGGFTPLIAAVNNAQHLCVEELLEATIRMELKTISGETALDIARRKGLTAICKLLEAT